MDNDFQLASDFKDELCPQAFEYYMNVVDFGLQHDSSYETDEDDDSAKGTDAGGDGGKTKQKKKKKRKTLAQHEE